MKSTNKTQKRNEQSKINFRAVFAGQTIVTPVIFNPTVDQIRSIKDIPETVELNEPTYKRELTMKNETKEYSVVSLLCHFNPNEQLKTDQYQEKVFVNYDILCSTDEVFGANSGKYQVIDDHNQSAWVKIADKRKSLEKQITDAVASGDYKDGDGIYKIDAKTARIAMQGEVALYDLLFNMSVLDKHNPEKDQELSGFVISDKPSEAFKAICNGDVSSINKYMSIVESDDDSRAFFITNGEQNKVGMMLGGQANKDKTKLYQTVMTPDTQVNVTFTCTYRPTDYDRIVNGFKELGTTRLSKEVLKKLTDAEYPWYAEWGNTLNLKEITLEDIKENNTSIDDEDDDLPF